MGQQLFSNDAFASIEETKIEASERIQIDAVDAGITSAELTSIGLLQGIIDWWMIERSLLG